MKKYLKYIIAVAVAVVAVILVSAAVKRVNKRTNAYEVISLVVKNRERLAELVTYKYCKDTLLIESEERTGLMSYFDSTPDTVAVLLVRPTVCAGVDLRHLKTEDFFSRNDTLIVSLPAPEILDLYVNHADITKVYMDKDWDFDRRIGPMTEKVKTAFEADALRQGILLKAKTRAESSMSEFLTLICGMPVVATCAPLDIPLEVKD